MLSRVAFWGVTVVNVLLDMKSSMGIKEEITLVN
jgi:hypothetical protein